MPNKFVIFSALFLVTGVVCFVIAAFAYHSLQNVYEVFAYYGANEKMYLSNPEIAEMIFNLKYGIVKFLVFGIISWGLSLFFYLKRNSKLFNIEK